MEKEKNEKDIKSETKTDIEQFQIEDPVPDPESTESPSNIPDGGWGWIVLLAAFFIRSVMSGVYVSFALYTTDFIREFKTSPSVMSWMISIYSSVNLLAAPAASLLADRVGHRILTIIGLMISGIFYPLTYFYPTLWFAFLTASIIVPFAQGLSNMCINVIITKYFNKRLSIAMGIYSCGTGFASFAVTPLMTIVISKFGWQLSRVFFSVLYIFACLAALTFKSPVTKPEKKTDSKDEEEKEVQNPYIENEKMDSFFGSKDSNVVNFLSMANINSQFQSNENYQTYFSSLQHLGTRKPVVDVNSVNVTNIPVSTLLGLSIESNLQMKAAMNNVNTAKLEVVVVKDDKPAEPKPKTGGLFDIFKNPVFLIFLFSNLLSNLGYDTPYIYTKAKGLELGFTEAQATFLLTCLGIGNIVGRLGFGFIGSGKKCNKYLLNTFCLLIAGTFILLSRVAYSFGLMVTYALGFGVFIGGYVTLGPVLLVHILDISVFSKGLSCLFVVQAIGLFVGAPISGLIYDATKSFNMPFISCGLLIIASGLSLLTAYLFKSFRQSQRK